MTPRVSRRALALVALPALLIGGAVFGTARIERSNAIDSAVAVQEGQQLLTAMLDQETGARGYFVTHNDRFLGPWYRGTTDYALALRHAQVTDSGDPELERDLGVQNRIVQLWHGAMAAAIAGFRVTDRSPPLHEALAGKAVMDSFRAANGSFMQALEKRRDGALSRATWLAVLLAAGLSLTLSLLGLWLLRRASRRDERRRRQEEELRQLLQASASERESRQLLIAHVQRTVPGTGVAVFNRNTSDDRLERTIGESVTDGPLGEIPPDEAGPRDCLAVRLSRPHERRATEKTLAECRMCGKLASDILCEPLLVGGNVIGSVLVTKQGRFRDGALAQIRDAVLQAAPILANQRTLSLAETRAASDALTGLPNRRAAEDTLRRMAAHAGRSLSPLAAVVLDLDHFKQINDRHGHEQGDEALAAVGSILSSSLRASDFAARYGGEEFLLLLPDTTREGACMVAEKLREAIAQAELRSGQLTASFGVAALPEDAGTPEDLIRQADRALYAAKERGRNRVELVLRTGEEAHDAPRRRSEQPDIA